MRPAVVPDAGQRPRGAVHQTTKAFSRCPLHKRHQQPLQRRYTSRASPPHCDHSSSDSHKVIIIALEENQSLSVSTLATKIGIPNIIVDVGPPAVVNICLCMCVCVFMFYKEKK